jgi:hypothetical protein
MMIGEPLSFPPVWLSDLGLDHPFLHLVRPGDRQGTTIRLGADPVLMREAVASLAVTFGKLDVVSIGAVGGRAELLLEPIREQLGSVRRLVDLEPWPFAWSVGASSRGEHRCCAIAACLYSWGRSGASVEFGVLTMLERNLCVDKVSVTASGDARVETIIELALQNAEQAPAEWAPELAAQMLRQDAVRRAMPKKLYYQAYLPEDVNLRLSFEWPGNFGGCNFGSLEGMYAMWLRHHGQWRPA